MDVRIELPVRLDLLEPLVPERVAKLPVHELDAFLELRLLVLGRRDERTLEIVEHRQQLLDEPLCRLLGPLALQAGLTLAVVVELRLQALETVEVLVALARHRFELVDRLDLPDLLNVLLDVLLGHDLPSSTTS